ncbi:Domain of unknown function DUF4774 [Cinara cedri]|uniref:DUF4774 domain-containing protein n=1 Tax=Cinara cedri TaxID=506608 RepID=A0A5E4NSX5_9HEMI|nr:Domain of unknown function DUF4774 [Cinara cedri]
MRRYPLPYWAFVPTLGVWPDARSRDGTVATVPLPPASGAIAVNLANGEVSVKDVRSENAEAVPPMQLLQMAVRRQHPNTPSIGGPSWLKKTTAATATATATTTTTTTTTKKSTTDPATQTGAGVASHGVARPVTKIYLKPSARAKAGTGGVALSNPISTAVVRRGDTVSIEYLPDATAEAGDGGVAISRPELVIHLVD